jgi:hypothetical protein
MGRVPSVLIGSRCVRPTATVGVVIHVEDFIGQVVVVFGRGHLIRLVRCVGRMAARIVGLHSILVVSRGWPMDWDGLNRLKLRVGFVGVCLVAFVFWGLYDMRVAFFLLSLDLTAIVVLVLGPGGVFHVLVKANLRLACP